MNLKKNYKKILLMLGLMTLVFVLTGCGTSKIDASSEGIWDHYIVWTFTSSIKFLADIFGGNFGVGIILFTIIIRVILLPLMHFQTKSMRKTTEIQPQLKALQQKYASKDMETQQKLQEETKKLYAEAGVNPMMGCLPIVVQMPIMLALYQSISRTDVLKTGHFLWMSLGDKDPYYILPILAGIFTFATSYLSSMSQLEKNGMMTAMTYLMPLMIVIPAIQFPAALSLYWVISNAFSVGQTLFLNNPFKIRAEREEKAKAERDRAKALAKAKRKYKKK